MNEPATVVSAIDDLLSRAAPKAKQFRILMQSGDEIVFAYPADYPSFLAEKREAKSRASQWANGKVHEAWKEHLVRDEETLQYVHLLACRCVKVRLFRGIVGEGEERKPVYDDAPRFEHLDFLKLAHWAGGFAALREEFDRQIAVTVVSLEIDAINDAKKG